MRRGDGLIAHFHGGPAHGTKLQVRGTRAWIAMIDDRPTEVPDTPDEPVLNKGAGHWTLYVAIGDINITGGVTRYVPA